MQLPVVVHSLSHNPLPLSAWCPCFVDVYARMQSPSLPLVRETALSYITTHLWYHKHTLYAVYVSNPLVGSSRKRMLGLVIISIPSARRLFSPPAGRNTKITFAYAHTVRRYCMLGRSSTSLCLPRTACSDHVAYLCKHGAANRLKNHIYESSAEVQNDGVYVVHGLYG